MSTEASGYNTLSEKCVFLTDGATGQPRELPVPPDFPVTWESEEERSLLWRWDNIHSPLPASPMLASFVDARINPGATRAGEAQRRAGRVSGDVSNGYSYSAALPETPTSEQREQQRRATQEAVAVTRRRWDAEFLPALQRDLECMRGVDLLSATDHQLLDYLDKFLEIQRDHWRIHFMVVFPISAAVEEMAALYREAMGPVPDEEPYLLLQGIDNKSLETGRALQALADEARLRPEVSTAFAEVTAAQAIMSRLRESAEGRQFLKRLEEFLTVYGYRPTGFDFVYPSWIEDPSFVILNVKSYLSSPPRNLRAETAALAAESQHQLDRVLDKLAGDEARRRRFLDAYEKARALWPLKEDHAFYIDQGSTASVRVLIAEMGRRLTRRGALDEPGYVFYLTLDELREAMEATEPQGLHQIATARREERERFMKVIPPPFLGTLPGEDAQTALPEFRRMIGPVSGSPPDHASSVLRGVTGSRGAATGPAKVVRTPEEFGKVRPGDVLVCTSTSPTWTPLFGSLSALVSDSGGVLSHTAIVAREYRLPAVVGVGYGTSIITDGQVVTVDGDSGVVLLR